MNTNKILNYLLIKYGFVLPDKLYLSLLLKARCDYWPHLNEPRTYNEKLQWLKLYNRRPEYTQMVDKYAVKEFVAQRIGEEYVIPTLGIWDRPEDIEWDKLPNQFVLKTTHGGGNTGVVICKDKKNLDKQDVNIKLGKSLKQDLYKTVREWPYKNVPRRIIAESFIEDGSGDLPDYKFFCFDGVVKALFIGTERSTGDVKFDYYDADFNHLDLVQVHPMSGKVIPKPMNFEEMKQIASKLSEGIPHVRIDLYNVNGRIYFGEMTFYHHGGVTPFHPKKWDRIFGDWITLPSRKYIQQ